MLKKFGRSSGTTGDYCCRKFTKYLKMPVTSTPVEIKYSVSKLTFINIKRNFSFKNTSSLNKIYKCFYTSLKMKFTKIDKLFFK